MKTDVELLNLLKEEMLNNRRSGLCAANINTDTNNKERYRMLDIINDNAPFKFKYFIQGKRIKTNKYFWKEYEVKPRIKWINKMIKKYS